MPKDFRNLVAEKDAMEIVNDLELEVFVERFFMNG